MRAGILETKMIQEENTHENQKENVHQLPTVYWIWSKGMASIILLNSPNYPVFTHFTM